MSTYVELQNRINLDYLNRGTTLVSETKRAIQASIRQHERKRWWFNETSTAIVTVASQTYATLPSNFLVLDLLQITVSSMDYKLVQKDLGWIRAANASRVTGEPTHFAYYNDRIELFPIPNSAYSLPVYYIKSLTALSADSDTSAWTEGVTEDLIVYGATKNMMATVLHDNDGAAVYAGLERQALHDLRSANEQRLANKLKSNY